MTCLKCKCELDRKAKSILMGQCSTCRSGVTVSSIVPPLTITSSGDYGSVIIAGTMTRAELAQVKKQLYETEKTLAEIDTRKAEFMRKAQEEADKMLAEVEKVMGEPIKDLRLRNKALRERLQLWMKAHDRNQMLIRDMLVEVKNTIVNRGNAPLWTQITEKMGAILQWSKDELNDFVKANYSLPQFADRLFTTFLPPGERKRRKQEMEQNTKVVSTYHASNLSIPRIAEIETDFLRSGARLCRINTPSGVFILTGEKIQSVGLAQMLMLQGQTKTTLQISDTEQEGDSTYVLVEGSFAFDPNSVRAFLAERFPDREVGETEVVNPSKIAVEMRPIGGESPLQIATGFFDELGSILLDLSETEKAREELAVGMMHTVRGYSQADTPDSNVDDLFLVHDRAQPARGAPGTYGNGGADGGIMSPNGGAPNISTGS